MSSPAQADPVLSPTELQLSTDRRLLLAAERLFAEHGIDAVSLRSVMAAAEANVASVHYHFGTKGDLVAALLRDRAEEMHRRRLELLAGTVRGEPTLAELAFVLAGPIIDVVSAGASDWVRVLAQILERRDSAPELGEVFAAQQRDWDLLYDQVCPGLSSATRAFRVSQALGLAIRVLGERDQFVSWLHSAGGRGEAADLHREVVAAIAGLLAGPDPISIS